MRSVGVPRLPSAFLRPSRPSRSYVQGSLPPCVQCRLRRRYRLRARSTGRQIGKPNSILEQKDAKDAKNAQYRARSVGVPRLPSAFLRPSRPSRPYVQGFLPPCVRFRPGRWYRPRAHRARSMGRHLGKPNSILEQTDAKVAKSAQYRARSVVVPRLPSDFLRPSRPSRSYVQGLLPRVRGFPARLARASEPDVAYVQQQVQLASRPLTALSARLSLSYVEKLLAPARTRRDIPSTSLISWKLKSNPKGPSSSL
jgi:hypothetical protein